METTLATLTRWVFLLGVFAAPACAAGDADDLTMLLHDFLATVTEKQTHERFWADDLIYTSSSGTRFDKSVIMDGFDDAGDDEGDSGPVYTAEEIQVHVYGAAAVVAFKLVATPTDDSPVLNYLNTGTFIKRDGAWQAVAWQATRVTPAE